MHCRWLRSTSSDPFPSLRKLFINKHFLAERHSLPERIEGYELIVADGSSLFKILSGRQSKKGLSKDLSKSRCHLLGSRCLLSTGMQRQETPSCILLKEDDASGTKLYDLRQDRFAIVAAMRHWRTYGGGPEDRRHTLTTTLFNSLQPPRIYPVDIVED